MNITVSARHSNIPENTKEYAREKAEKLEKYYTLRKAEIIMDIEGDEYIVEVVAIPDHGKGPVVGHSKADEWFAAIDQAHDKVERQLRKLKGKVKSHRVKKHKSERTEKVQDEEETYEDVVDKM